MIHDLAPKLTLSSSAGSVTFGSYPYGLEVNSLDIGEPELVTSTTSSLIGDGDVVDEERAGNRQIEFDFRIDGGDLVESTANQAAVRKVCRGTGITLTLDPGDADSAFTVWDVAHAVLAHDRDDDAEANVFRQGSLSLSCYPYGRSKDLTVSAALPVFPENPYVPLSLADWAWECDGVPTVGTVGPFAITATPAVPASTWRVTRTIPVTVADRPYVEMFLDDSPRPPRVRATSNGAELVAVSAHRVAGATTRFVFFLPDSIATALTFWVDFDTPRPSLTMHRPGTGGAPVGGVSRQLSRIVPVGGTERAPASIHVSRRSGGPLWDTIVHTAPVVPEAPFYDPSLMQLHRLSGTTSFSEPTSRSLLRVDIGAGGTPAKFRVNHTELPRGQYLIALLSKPGAVGSAQIKYTVRALSYDGVVERATRTATRTVTWAGAWETLHPLGIISLPLAPSDTSITEVTVERPSGVSTVNVHDVYLFRIDADCGLTAANQMREHLWINHAPAASAAEYRTGDEADGFDAYDPGQLTMWPGTHRATPGLMSVWTSSSADHPDVAIESYDRWAEYAEKVTP